jgi:nucleoside-diphosphate-sugar epimerase
MNGSSDNAAARTVLLTGATGYLGRLVTNRLRTAGWKVIPLSRNPVPGGVAFTLGQPVKAETLAGYDALIHAAYDFSLVSRKEIDATNVEGSANLFRAAEDAGVGRIVAISTISAFTRCKSNYGQAKLAIEEHARAAGACIIRPGLIYGASPGAMFGRLVSQVKSGSVIPVPGDGRQLMYTVHEDDLTDAILRALTVSPAPAQPITVANRTPLSFRHIMALIGQRLGRKVRPVPVPWRAMWLMLRAAEIARVPLGLRSDSLISLVNQDTNPDINADLIDVTCRPFSLDSVSLTP